MATYTRNSRWMPGLTGIVILCAWCSSGCSRAGSASQGWVQRARQVADHRLEQKQPQTAGTVSTEQSSRGTPHLPPTPCDETRGVTFRLASQHSAPASDTPAGNGAPAGTESQPSAPQPGPLPGFRETLARDLKGLPKELWSDTKAVYGNPWNLVFLLGAGGASAALRPEVDDDIEDHYDRHHSLKEDWRDAFGAAGNPITHFAMAGLWYLVGQQAQDVKTYETGKRMFSALAITGLTTMLLKVAAYTESPNGENLAWPSGHVSSTMALATVLNHAYGPLVGVPMFGLTGLVALERLDSGEHHFSDVVFGAALGWVVAEQVMKEHAPEVLGGRIVPYADPASGNAGIAWVKPLGR